MTVVDEHGLIRLADRNPVCKRILVLRQFIESAKRGMDLPTRWDFFPPMGKYLGAEMAERICDLVVSQEPTTWYQVRTLAVEALLEDAAWQQMSASDRVVAKDVMRGIFTWLEAPPHE